MKDKRIVEPNIYVLAPNITKNQLIAAGFEEKFNVMNLKHSLYKNNMTKLIITITDDFYMSITVTDSLGNIFPAFYNPSLRYNNEVYNEVVQEYNKFMNGLAKKKILIKEKEHGLQKHGKKIQIKYFTTNIDKLDYIDGKSDWIDLRASKEIVMKKGEFKLIPLGVAMKLPDGYEAHIVPRSSTYKNFGIIQTNSMGVIDSSYCGDQDEWKFPAYALRDTAIHMNDRICQFRIVENQPRVQFEEVKHLTSENRGGFGSTGKR